MMVGFDMTATEVLDVWAVVGGSFALVLGTLWVTHHIWQNGCFGCKAKKSQLSSSSHGTDIAYAPGTPPNP